jgi:hypothetical protein
MRRVWYGFEKKIVYTCPPCPVYPPYPLAKH